MFCLRNRDLQLSHSARLTSYDNKSLSWHIYMCDVHRRFLNDQSRRQIEYLIVFNIFTVCVLYEIQWKRVHCSSGSVKGNEIADIKICQRSQNILNSFPFDKLTRVGFWCKYLHNEKEFCYKNLNWKWRSNLLNNLF